MSIFKALGGGAGVCLVAGSALALLVMLTGCLDTEPPAVPTRTLLPIPTVPRIDLSPVPTVTTLPDEGGTVFARIGDILLPPNPTLVGARPAQQPSGLIEIGHLELPGQATNLSLVGDQIFVAAGQAGVHIVDVSEPARPMQSGRVESIADDVAASPEFLAVLSTDSEPHLRVFEIQDIAGPVGPPEVIPPAPVDSVGPANMTLRADVLILAGGSASAQFVELRSRPMEVAAIIPTRKAFVRISVFAALAFLTEDTGGPSPYVIIIYDLSDIRRPSKVSEIELSGAGAGSTLALPANFPLTSVFDPPYLYVAGGGAITIYGLTDLNNPVELRKLETGEDTMHIALEGGAAVISNGDVLLIDVSDPARPRQVASFKTPGQARMSIIRGGVIYVADGDNGLVVLRTQ